jgi:hypothetical protein
MIPAGCTPGGSADIIARGVGRKLDAEESTAPSRGPA